MDIYDKILELCNERNISFREVERSVGIGHGSINRWHNQMPKADTLQKVANYFGVGISYLLGETDDRNSEVAIDDEELCMLKIIKSRPELKYIIQASQDLDIDDLRHIYSIMRKMK